MKDSLHTILYATVMATFCALVLTGAAEFTEPYKQSNAQAEEMRSILSVLDAPFSPDASSTEMVEIFEQNVREEQQDDITLYIYAPGEDKDNIQAIAVKFAGPGLWGPIKGFLSLEPDMKTIRGIVFYEQEETPGLGGDIAKDDFRDQFKGKTIEIEPGSPGIYLVRGGATAANEVDAITGATMTCDKVQQMLNKVIKKIRITK